MRLGLVEPCEVRADAVPDPLSISFPCEHPPRFDPHRAAVLPLPGPLGRRGGDPPAARPARSPRAPGAGAMHLARARDGVSHARLWAHAIAGIAGSAWNASSWAPAPAWGRWGRRRARPVPTDHQVNGPSAGRGWQGSEFAGGCWWGAELCPASPATCRWIRARSVLTRSALPAAGCLVWTPP